MIKSACILILVTALSVMTPVLSRAENFELPQIDVPTTEQDVGEAISPLKKGDKAPFSGVHLSPRAVAKIKVELDSFDDKLKIETDRVAGEVTANFEKKLADAETRAETEKKIADAKLEYNDYIIKQLDKRLQEEVNSRPNVIWVIAGTAVVTAAVTTLIFYAASQSSN